MKRYEAWRQKKHLRTKYKKAGMAGKELGTLIEALLTMPKKPTNPAPILTATTLHPRTAPGSASSPFFTTLPFEIRHLIYTHLFGNRAIHLNLRRGRTAYKPSFVNTTGPIGGDLADPNVWRWWTCICHEDSWRGFCEGNCLYEWGGRRRLTEKGGEWFVDALGWLLSCRQAYFEGVRVLYGSNRFLIGPEEGDKLFAKHLGEVFLGERLAMVTRVEFVWGLREFDELDRESGRGEFGVRLGVVGEWLVNLRELRVTASPLCYPKEELLEAGREGEEALLALTVRPVDGLVRKLKKLRDCHVVFGRSYYRPIREALDKVSCPEERLPIGPCGQFWRSVDDAEGGKGYWISYIEDVFNQHHCYGSCCVAGAAVDIVNDGYQPDV